jgi:cytochrome c
MGGTRGRVGRISRCNGRRRCLVATAAIAFAVVTFVSSVAHADGDAARGELLYHGCEDCHSLDKNDVGPMHRGVVGRPAGTVPGYNYSPALKKSNIVWTEDNLDKWLTNPQSLVLGTKMFYKVNNPQDRADLIAFLKERAK